MSASPSIPFQLYAVPLCPYVHRAHITLRLKKANYKFVTLDFSNGKPDWFLALNPIGKVPVLIHQGRALRESALLVDYLDDVLPQNSVYPSDPYQRHQTRLFLKETEIEKSSYAILFNLDETKKEALHAQYLSELKKINNFLLETNPDGIFAFGENLTSFDINLAPFIFQLWVLEHYRSFQIPQNDEFARFNRWREHLVSHPAVAESFVTKEELIEAFSDIAATGKLGSIAPGKTERAILKFLRPPYEVVFKEDGSAETTVVEQI